MNRAKYLRWMRGRLLVAALLGLAGLQGCKTHDDAVTAAEQMAVTAATMQQYYATVGTLVTKTEEVQRAQTYLNGIPFDAAGMAQLEDTRAEIGKRARLAGEIATLSAAFAEITNSQAATDAATAAGALNNQLVALKVGASSDVAMKALQVAVTSLVNALRAHDEVKAAKLLEPVLTGVCNFFDSEKATYVSFSNSYYETAASNAKALIAQDQVATNERYRSSLAPFGLKPDVHAPGLLKAAREDMTQQVDQQKAQREQDDADAADGMSDSLHRMQARVDQVAKGRALAVRIPPLTLEGVKGWIAEVEADTGVVL